MGNQLGQNHLIPNHFRKDPTFQASARSSFTEFRALGSAIWRVRQDTFAEQVKARQDNMTATWGFGKRYALHFVGVQRGHLAEPLMGGPVVLSDHSEPDSSIDEAKFGPKWSIHVHLTHGHDLGPPTVLWPLLMMSVC